MCLCWFADSTGWVPCMVGRQCCAVASLRVGACAVSCIGIKLALDSMVRACCSKTSLKCGWLSEESNLHDYVSVPTYSLLSEVAVCRFLGASFQSVVCWSRSIKVLYAPARRWYQRFDSECVIGPHKRAGMSIELSACTPPLLSGALLRS